MKTGSWTGMFSETEKVEKVMSALFSFRKSHPGRKKGLGQSARGFISLADQQSCSSRCEMARWTIGTTWQGVSGQTQTLQTEATSPSSLCMDCLCSHHPQAHCPDPPPTAEPVEATVTTALDTSEPSLQSRWEEDGLYQSLPFRYHWSWASEDLCVWVLLRQDRLTLVVVFLFFWLLSSCQNIWCISTKTPRDLHGLTSHCFWSKLVSSIPSKIWVKDSS